VAHVLHRRPVTRRWGAPLTVPGTLVEVKAIRLLYLPDQHRGRAQWLPQRHHWQAGRKVYAVSTSRPEVEVRDTSLKVGIQRGEAATVTVRTGVGD
jgi:hypothetical protein